MGLVQGLTEFLPVSSTAHLRLVPELFGQADPGPAYSAVIQLGTLLAVVGYFARDLFVDMPRALLKDRGSFEARLAVYLVLATIPIAVAGLALKDYITDDFRSLYVLSSALIGVGVLFFVVERVGRGDRLMNTIALGDALLIGVAQACALVPGVSRSGATIACALVLGLRRSEAARFSFLLGVPAIAGAGLFELPEALRTLGSDAVPAIVIGTTVAAISGYASIAWLLRFLGRRSLATFGAYRIVLGMVILSLCASGVLAARSGG
jgi:undecaprenyl-diphosphatase